ncbi:hypothetical protein YK48G_05920 [Lentilactobacillus fungorum]|uniref:Collagen binding domain-containing protein n=1 Tax=Lentilactobacillus fungorum TaxID=2201250 RepID=A0ABQ3VY02_9LACO|nr:Cna B-type domain-containing protein [Lentilactobacillus fungorum]GHP13167.1 hypothetical protein YK48G_05920 [Lentilactobacillus fungorum]
MGKTLHKIYHFAAEHFRLLAIVAVLLCSFAQAAVVSQSASADSLDSQITGLTANDAQENGATVSTTDSQKWYAGPVHNLTYNFKINDNVTVKDGDTATVTLPTGAVFRTPEKFDIKASNTQETVGQFTADPNTTTGQVTFSNAAYWAKYHTDRNGTLQFSVTGTRAFTPSYGVNVYLAKNGWAKNESVRSNGTLSQVTWQILVNPNNHKLNNVKVQDKLGNTSAQSIDPSSIYVTDNATGQKLPATQYTVTPSATGFDFQWNGSLDKAINIMLTTNISDDNAYSQFGQELDLPNTASINATDVTNSTTGTPVTTSNTKTVVLTMGKGSASGNYVDQKTNVTVKKVWKDVPCYVTTPATSAKLYADGVDTGKTVDLNADNAYTATFSGLEKFAKDGHAIKYTVNEANVPNRYKTDPQGNPQIAPDANGVVTLTNVYQWQNTYTYVNVVKQWQNVPFWKCKPCITVTLYRDGNPYRHAILDNCNGFQTTFAYLPQYDAQGNEYHYTVAEKHVPWNYETTTPGQRTPVNHTVTLVNVYKHHSLFPCWDF